MTARTHDLVGFTALMYVIATQSIPQMTVATAIVALGANILGSTAPDIDEPTAGLWHRLPAGSILGRVVKPLLGGHRLISHSILGLVVIGFALRYFLQAIDTILIVDMDVVWWSFMIGFVSHLISDTITKEGVPWFFPIPWRIGIPPFRFLRITTGEVMEKGVIFPGLLVLNGYIIYMHYSKFVEVITRSIQR